MKVEEIGGWWETCYPYTGQPSKTAWKVSPRIGLNGLSICKYAIVTLAKKAAIYFNLCTGSFWLAAF
jgi:hypothetical protein